MARKQKDEPNDLGFGAVALATTRSRFLNNDGSFNVRREGLGFWSEEIEWDADFVDIFDRREGLSAVTIDVSKLHDTRNVSQ
jgi:hypothetical protein